MQVQPSGRHPLQTKLVYYKGTEKPPIGGVLCYDIAAPTTPAAGTFDEEVLGTRCIKPATANLMLFAGIVINDEEYQKKVSGAYDGFYRVISPTKGAMVEALVYFATGTAGSSLLKPVDAKWYLGTTSFDVSCVAMLMETGDWSSGGTPAVDVNVGVKKIVRFV